MNCYVHVQNEPVGNCVVCNRPICSECAVEIQGRLTCRTCLANRPTSLNANQSAKDVNTAFIIELVGGFFGLLGLGYFYDGRTNDGVLRLICWIVYDIIAAIAISLLLAAFVGICCIPFQLAIQVGVPLWSANELKKQMLAVQNPSPM